MNKRIKLFAVAIISICTLVSFIYWNNREESSDISTPTEAPQPIEVALSPESDQESTLDSELESLLPPPLTDGELDIMLWQKRLSAEAEAKRIEIENESTHETVQNIMYKESFVYLNPFFEDGYIETIMLEPRMVKLHQQLSSDDDAIRKEIFDSIRTMSNVYLNDLPLFSDPEILIPQGPSVHDPGGAGAYALLLGEFDTTCTTFPLLVSMHKHNQYAAKQRKPHFFKEGKNPHVHSPTTHLFAEGERMMLDRMLNNNEIRIQLTPYQNEVLDEYEAFKAYLEQSPQGFSGNIVDNSKIFKYATKFVENTEN